MFPEFGKGLLCSRHRASCWVYVLCPSGALLASGEMAGKAEHNDTQKAVTKSGPLRPQVSKPACLEQKLVLLCCPLTVMLKK
jgi:hypothetical protein